jgi:NTE family protein
MVKMVAKVSRWPEAVDLRLAATDCATGQTKLWSIKDNVPIISAIASSCCVPKIAPPIKINGRKYVDGGCGSANNLDKITETEARRVIFVGPFGGEHSAELGQEKLYLKQDAEQLRQAGYEVLLITPSERLAKEAGNDFLNPRLTPVAVECGIEDGLRITEEVRSFIAGRLTTI